MTSMLPTLNEGFTNASMNGDYAVTCVSEGGYAPSGALGVYRFDGNGGFSGSIVVNGFGQPFGQRAILTATLEGSYTIDDNGSGYGSLRATVRFDAGFSRDVSSTILITKAKVAGDTKIAQEIALMEDEIEPATGGLNMVNAIRYPDDGTFSLASFSGTSGGPGLGRGGRAPAAAIGIGAVNFDGNGGFTAVDIQNLPRQGFTERYNATFDTENGRYTVNPDGTGRIIAPGGQAPLVVTRCKVEGTLRVALEYFFITDDAHPVTGNLVTTTVSKRLP